MAEAFAFELVSPERLVAKGEAHAVVLPGADGYLTVMARHAPLMSLVKPGVVEAQMANGEKLRMFVRGGFADVSPEGLSVLAEFAVPLAELSAEALDQQIKDAEEDLADADSEQKREKARVALQQLHDAREAVRRAR
jgi:F-type H+-transporting ATPase subunit epsilon